MNQTLSATVQQLTPPFIWNAYMRFRGRRHLHGWREFGTMATTADPSPLFDGKFGRLFAEYARLDPVVSPEGVRYLNYACCKFAEACRDVPGDFLYAGVSYGFGAKLLYEFTDRCFGKTFHLVDPFDATVSRSDRRASASYNNSADYVRNQYPAGAKIVIHQTAIPMQPPKPLAFVVLRTSDPPSEEKALPDFWNALSPGGIMIACTDRGLSGVEPMWLPTGHAVFFKRRD
jgi:hypothetical protein